VKQHENRNEEQLADAVKRFSDVSSRRTHVAGRCKPWAAPNADGSEYMDEL